MANINKAQETSGSNIGAGTTITASLSNTVAGSTLAGFIYSSNTVTVSSISDSQGNTYTIGTSIDNTTSGTRLTPYYANNIVGGASANTVTVTYSGSVSNRFMSLAEIRQVQTNPLDGVKTRFQSSPGTSTDAATTQSDAGSTNANQPALVYSICCVANSATTVTAGTGFNQGLQLTPAFSGLCVATEDKRVTATAAQAATYTLSANNNALMALMVFDELPSGGYGLSQISNQGGF
ncbi:MAG: hypothetical protein U1F35_05410 [Steroidobacteraceae bacterium]